MHLLMSFQTQTVKLLLKKNTEGAFSQQIKGFTLLEALLIIALAAVLVVVSINRYQYYAHQSVTMEVKSDVTSILEALNDYFHQQGCSSNGRFAGTENPSITEDLGLIRLAKGRSPLVSEYSVAIMDDGTITQDAKPVYQLQVTATLSEGLSSKALAWYQTALNASLLDEQNHELIWQRMPTNNIDSANDQFWVLNGTLSRFRQWTNGIDGNAASYCAQ